MRFRGLAGAMRSRRAGIVSLVKMVCDRGFEPISVGFFMFSLLLMFAFWCSDLHAKIQAFPSYSKGYSASLCNNGQK
jgi:hypothetical protein